MMVPTRTPPRNGERDLLDNVEQQHHQQQSSHPSSATEAVRQRIRSKQQQMQQGNPSFDGKKPIRRRPLQSLTVGGYGPVPIREEEEDDHHHHGNDKPHPITFISTSWKLCGICISTDEKEHGKYYRDDFNDQSWVCSAGTDDENGIWMNTSDQAGTIMAFLVWTLLGYSAITMTSLAATGGIPPIFSIAYTIICALALACHAKTTFTDPGSIPASAVPVESSRKLNPDQQHSMCSQCQTFKPQFSHHCRICNRCIARMDHHCPWMNNCIGAGNMKHFILFLLYTWSCSAFSLLLLGWNYFFCANEDCEFSTVLVQLVRVMTILSTASFLFTSSMIMNVFYGLMTGIGTIDRLKKKATNTMMESEEEPIPLKDVFGIGPLYLWPFPIDPLFDDYDRVMGYSTPQRLLREQMKANPNAESHRASSVVSTGSFP